MRKIGSREGEVESQSQGRCPGCSSGGRQKLRVEDKVRSLGWGKHAGGRDSKFEPRTFF